MFHLHLAFPFRPDRPAPDSERYWLEGHGPMAVRSPAVSDGYVQSHRVDVDPAAPRPRYEGVAESWSASESTTRGLHPLLTGPPPDFANFMDVANAFWSVGRDRHLIDDGQAHGGRKSLHLVHVTEGSLAGRADDVERALRAFAGRCHALRRLTLCVRDRSFEWYGTASLDLAVHAWPSDPGAVGECGDALDAALADLGGLDHLVSLRAEEIVMVPPTG